ncbi:MAG: arginase family protein [Acidimicrobiia bacterium]|nr:arginase family protein [Acidimicrobiia bacterium]
MATYSVPYFMGDRLSALDVPGPHTLIEPSLPAGSQQERMAVLYRHLADAVAADEAPVVWAGDCVSSIGVLAGLQRRGLEPTVVWFDAHGDFNTWETTPSGFIGGMPLAMMVGRGEQAIVEGSGMRAIPESSVALVGARDLDSGESEAVAASGLTVLSVADLAAWEAAPGLLYVHVDVDVVDPSDMPAMNYPAPDGPSLAAVAEALGRLAATGRVAAFSMSLWNPELAGAEIAATACATLAEAFAG